MHSLHHVGRVCNRPAGPARHLISSNVNQGVWNGFTWVVPGPTIFIFCDSRQL